MEAENLALGQNTMKYRRVVAVLLAVVLVGSALTSRAMAHRWRRLAPQVIWLGDVSAPVPFAGSYNDEVYEVGGYGEYAEYGPWAYSNRGIHVGCYPARLPVWAETGWLFRRIQVCR
jgi:hypothetical protein